MIDLPGWVDKETWRDFEEVRRKIRKPMTDAARKLVIRKLEQIYREYGHPPVAVLEQSILNAWQGVFPLSAGTSKPMDRDGISRGPVLSDEARERLQKRLRLEGKIQ